jgi:hypothetical protein
MTTRVSKEPERPRRFPRQSGWGDRNRQLPGPRWDAHDRGEQTTGDTVISAREEFERVETDGGESERPIVSRKRGNYPEGRLLVSVPFFRRKKEPKPIIPSRTRQKRCVSRNRCFGCSCTGQERTETKTTLACPTALIGIAVLTTSEPLVTLSGPIHGIPRPPCPKPPWRNGLRT